MAYTQERKPTLILVVDDEKQVVEAICEFLIGCGHAAIGATSASKALELVKAKSGDVSLVIMDVLLDDQLGPIVIDEMLDIQQDLKVLYLSGEAQDEAVFRSQSKLPLAMLHKPCPLGTIARTVEQLMSTKL